MKDGCTPENERLVRLNINNRQGKLSIPNLHEKQFDDLFFETNIKKFLKNLDVWEDYLLGGGFKYFLNLHPYLGKIPILTNIFQMG